MCADACGEQDKGRLVEAAKVNGAGMSPNGVPPKLDSRSFCHHPPRLLIKQRSLLLDMGSLHPWVNPDSLATPTLETK